MAEIRVGDLFSSFCEFQEKLKVYKQTKFVDFCISDYRTLESARKRCPKLIEKVPEEIKYYYVNLTCVHGGNFKMRKDNRGMRATS